jgi:hypothetical protein
MEPFTAIQLEQMSLQEMEQQSLQLTCLASRIDSNLEVLVSFAQNQTNK